MRIPVDNFHNYRHVDKTFYLDSDVLFYEPNYRHYRPSDELIVVVRNVIDSSVDLWSVHREDTWTHVMPTLEDGSQSVDLPEQGWKIHVSATPINCVDVLRVASLLLVKRRVNFKFANDIATLRMMTSKRWSRGGSGKFMTIYPAHYDEFLSIIDLINVALVDKDGPYILSDKRYRDSKCVYYRYGGIVPNYRLHFAGRSIPVLISPSGECLPDQRNAYFALPEWVSDPFPSDEPDDDPASTLSNGRYRLTKALAFSNTGGVYLGIDEDSGEQVVVKEARPFIEFGKNGEDATSRLATEAKVLEHLGPLKTAPRLRDRFWDWENFYLVEEYIEGADIRVFMLDNTPLVKVFPCDEDARSFYDRYILVIRNLLSAVRKIHASGVVVGDLSPANILIERDTYDVRIIDLEGAFRPDADAQCDLYTQGFRQSRPRKSEISTPSDDIYAIGVIMMYCIFPIAALAYIRGDVFSAVLPVLVTDAGLGNSHVVEVATGLIDGSLSLDDAATRLSEPVGLSAPSYRPSPALTSANVNKVVDSLAAFVCSNARLTNDYELFPLDPFGQLTNPLGFGFGSCGIMYALSSIGAQLPAEGTKRYRNELRAVDCSRLPPGLLVGLAGMAWTSLLSGDTDNGTRFLNEANSSPLVADHHSLYHGMSGVGLANVGAYLETSDRRYLEAAITLGERLLRTADENDRGVFWHDGDAVRIGFGYGQSGVALFLLRLTQATGEAHWRNLGERALAFDLSYGIETEPDVLSFGADTSNTSTLENYIEQGSAGIAKVALRYGFNDDLDRLLNGAFRKYSLFPGLIYGLSSFVDVLTDACVFTGNTKYLEMAQRPVSGLVDLYIHQQSSGLALPGDSLFRISCDYATGIAGVLYTLNRFLNPKGDRLWLDNL